VSYAKTWIKVDPGSMESTRYVKSTAVLRTGAFLKKYIVHLYGTFSTKKYECWLHTWQSTVYIVL